MFDHCLVSKKKGFLLVRLSGRWKFHKRVIKICEKVAENNWNILFKKFIVQCLEECLKKNSDLIKIN